MAVDRTVRSPLVPTVFTVMAVLLACAVVVILGLLARPAGGLHLPAGSRVVHVDESDFAIHIDRTTLSAGNYVFVDTNNGPSAHEFVMWKTDATAARLPLGRDHRVNEDSPALEGVIDSGSSLQPHETRLLTAALDPGHYVVVCNLPGHYRAGMRVDVTVR